MAEGALESGRKDIARLLREIADRPRPAAEAAASATAGGAADFGRRSRAGQIQPPAERR